MRKRLSVFSCLWLSLLFSCILTAQETTLYPTVVDEHNQPLIGVHVFNDDKAAVTDENGQVLLVVSSDTALIRFEYLGYKDMSLTREEIHSTYEHVQLVPDDELLEEIVIYGRTDAREIDLPYQVSRIKAEDIFRSNAQNSADALTLNSGVYVQKSQLGGGSPVLRGFEANKVLLVVDGVRMNNAIYRNGHLQNAITIDPAILEQMEVIFGAGSLLYGSEALGGVIHFRTRNPLLDFSEDQQKRHGFNAHVRYNTADQENTIHLDHTYSARSWAVLSSASFSKRSDLRTGSKRDSEYPEFGKRQWFVEQRSGEDIQVVNDNVNLQVGTGYSQLDLLQKWAWRPSDVIKTQLNIQYSTSSDIPRYDALTELRSGSPRFGEWSYGPQSRLLISPKFTLKSSSALFEKSTLILSYQDIEEERITRDFRSPIRNIQNENVKVLGLTLDFNKRLSGNQKLTYGVDMHHNTVLSTVDESDIATGEKFLALTRYPNGKSSQQNFGVYAQHNWQNKDSSMVWINGLRYSNQRTDLGYADDGAFDWPSYFYEGITNKAAALVGISGLNYRKGPYLIKLSSGTAFRSPNVDDLAKVRVNGDEITVPNPELKSERVWNNEMTVQYTAPEFKLSVTGYLTSLSQAIVREDFSLPDGSTSFVSRQDTLKVTANVNAESGRIRGLSFSASAQLLSQLQFEGGLSIQHGTAESTAGIKRPLGHIPPTYGRCSLTYTMNKLALTANYQFNAWKSIEDYGGSVDNPDLGAIDRDGNEVGAPAWQSFGVSAQVDIGKEWTLNIAGENLLDRHYRPFASGVSGAGRHLVLAMRYSIDI